MMPLCIILVLLSQVTAAVNITSGIIQDSGVIKAGVGENVTLKCACQDNAVTFLSWYQQSLGGKPQIISTRMKHKKEADMYPGYKERFQVSTQNKEGNNHLTITNLRPADSAIYYCGILEFNAIEFGQGAFLHVKTPTSNIQAVVHQPDFELLRPGDPLSLSCTVYAEPLCEGEQSLYWFRNGASQPTVMDPSGGQCTSLSSHVKNCTADLTLKSASSSDAGMYYCALASCGEITFGNGTRVEIVDVSTKVSPLMLYFLSVALAVSIIILLVLAFSAYMLNKKLCSLCKGTVSHLTCSAASDTRSQDADMLHYAALSVKRNSERHGQDDNMDTDCVYSRVKSRKESCKT
uniref:Tyrosine-protein phosphatase non-receptor type substrate 1-like n=1 Tax=Seriola lalandi dorsalis TaxID=1841481 RepID=A0A3B4Y6N3_SERLL